jgi:cyclohexanone monooxygenase
MNKIDKPKLKGVDFDAVVLGAGFGGLYSVHKLRNELGLHVQAYEKGEDLGGTWYWNRYPGALSDTESHIYRLSFDKEFLQEETWKNRYITQPEILQYFRRMADRFDLRRSYQFNTMVTSAQFNEQNNFWEITTDKGDRVTAKFLVTGLGLLSATNIPDIKGRETFKGEQYHTSQWPSNVNLEGKRVGVIGNGSTGVQIITAIAPVVKHLTVFQRTPQYSVPAGQRPLSEVEIANIKNNYDEIWEQVFSSATCFGFEESTVEGASVSEEERERVFEENWNKGGGFRFMFGTFCDVVTNPEVNEAVCEFVRKKIREIVKDPEVARKLSPTDYYLKRPLCDNGYYETFNRENVSLADIKEHPIIEFTPKGIKTTEGEYELDVIIYATGFDAIEGSYLRMDIRGRKGLALREKWADVPTGYFGTTTTGFPNLFMILGPHGPFSSLPPAIETQVNWISDTVKYTLDHEIETIEPSAIAEKEWIETCDMTANSTLFPKSNAWFFGANIPGKKVANRLYYGGVGNYRKALKDLGYSGFIFKNKKSKQVKS